MNLQQIEYIVALDKYKSFSKAAEACFITQATLSTMIKKLEEELGVVIFDRKTHPVITSDIGQEMIAEAKKVLFHSQRLREMSSILKGKIEGTLRVGVIPTIAGNLLHRILPQLLEKYPNLLLNVQEITTQNIVSKLKIGELDIGIVSTPLPKNNELEEEVLYYEKLMVYGAFYPTAGKYLSPRDMVNEDIWLLEQGNCLSDQVMNICALNPKKVNANLNFHPNSFDSLINIVDSLKGLTLIPELYFMDLPKEKKANVIDFHAPYPVREVSLVYHRPYAKERLIQALAQEIKAIISPILQTTSLLNSEMLIAKM